MRIQSSSIGSTRGEMMGVGGKNGDLAGGSPRALVTGLKILEHLTETGRPATYLALAAALKLSTSSVYRSLLVLEQRGYVVKTGKDGAFERTGKFGQAPLPPLSHQRLVAHARPVMRTLSESVLQSCNLAIPCSPDLQVVAQEESPGPFGINVPIGFRYDIPASAPGLAFAAFMKNSDPSRWPHGLSDVVDSQNWTLLRNAVRRTAEAGFAQITNAQLPDVTDIACPIFDGAHFVAALTVPYIQTRKSPNLVWCLAALQQAAEELNDSLHSDALVA